MSEPITPPAAWWRSTRVHVGAVLVLVIALAAGLFWHAQRLPANAAFRLDGATVTRTDLRDRATAMRALYGIELPDDPGKRAAYWRDLAKSDALGRVLAAQAAKRGLSVTRAAGEQALTKFVEQAYGADGEKAFADALVTAGTSRSAVVREIQRQLLTLKLYDAITDAIPRTTEAGTKAAFARWSCHFDTPEQRQIRNIVVLDKATATTVRRALDAGDPWSAAVTRYSQDQATVKKDGDLGLLRREQLDPAFGKAAFATSPGHVFGPVKSAGGWNVGVVARVVPAVPATYGQVKSAVALAALNQAKSTKWRAWISHQLKAAGVQYADSYQPRDPYAAPDDSTQKGQEALSDCPDPAAGK